MGRVMLQATAMPVAQLLHSSRIAINQAQEELQKMGVPPDSMAFGLIAYPLPDGTLQFHLMQSPNRSAPCIGTAIWEHQGDRLGPYLSTHLVNIQTTN